MRQINSRPITENLIHIEQHHLDEFTKNFQDELNTLRDAAIAYKKTDTEQTRHNFVDARSKVKDTIEFIRFFNSSIQEQQRKVNREIRQIQNDNTISKEQYKQTEQNTKQKLDQNLVSFPLKSQTELQKSILYLYIILQILGVFVAIMILYIQTQSKPSKKIKPKVIQKKAQKQLANTYSTGLGLTNQFGNRLLDYANRGTSYGLRQGRYASDGLAKFMFGNQVRK